MILVYRHLCLKGKVDRKSKLYLITNKFHAEQGLEGAKSMTKLILNDRDDCDTCHVFITILDVNV